MPWTGKEPVSPREIAQQVEANPLRSLHRGQQVILASALLKIDHAMNDLPGGSLASLFGKVTEILYGLDDD